MILRIENEGETKKGSDIAMLVLEYLQEFDEGNIIEHSFLLDVLQ